MAISGKAIKTRIKSVKNTKKMTKAMEMVSAAKMRKAVSGALATREYALLSRELLQNLSHKKRRNIPFLQVRPVKKLLVVLITSNRGLCGSFNANVSKKTAQVLQNPEVAIQRVKGKVVTSPNEKFEVDILGIGKKSASFAKKYGYNLIGVYDSLSEKPTFEDILPITRQIRETYEGKIYDKVLVIFTHYRSALIQEVKARQVLPVSEIDLDKMLLETTVLAHEMEEKTEPVEYIYEPDAETVLRDVLPRLVEIQLYEAILESSASEHSARMMAMKNASTAAGEMIDALTLEFNKARQAAITREISEIVAGAAALE